MTNHDPKLIEMVAVKLTWAAIAEWDLEDADSTGINSDSDITPTPLLVETVKTFCGMST